MQIECLWLLEVVVGGRVTDGQEEGGGERGRGRGRGRGFSVTPTLPQSLTHMLDSYSPILLITSMSLSFKGHSCSYTSYHLISVPQAV